MSGGMHEGMAYLDSGVNSTQNAPHSDMGGGTEASVVQDAIMDNQAIS